MHTFELKHNSTASAAKLWLALTDPKYITKWDGNRWVQNDACVGGKMRARTEEGTLAEAEIVLYQPGERIATLAPVPKNPEEPEEGFFLVRLEFTLEAQAAGAVLHMKATGFPDESSCTMMRNSWGGFYLEKIGKVAESIQEDDAQHARVTGNDFPGHVRHTELATSLQ